MTSINDLINFTENIFIGTGIMPVCENGDVTELVYSKEYISAKGAMSEMIRYVFMEDVVVEFEECLNPWWQRVNLKMKDSPTPPIRKKRKRISTR
jgi:hypothetical protein